MIILPQLFTKSGVGQNSYTPIVSTLASNVIDLDATITASTNGTSQTWSNLCTTPADGSSQATYDHYRGDTSGATSKDPTFSGSAGSAAAYWLQDGTQFFTIVGATTSPPFLKDLHREDQTNTTSFAIAFQFIHSGGATQNLFGNNSSSSTAHPGFRLGISTADKLVVQRVTGDAVNTTNILTSTMTFTTGTDYLLSFTMNSSTLAYKISKNGTSFSETGSFTTLTAATNKNSAVDTWSIGASNKSITMANTTRIYAASMFNSILSDADLVTLRGIYETRHGRLYH